VYFLPFRTIHARIEIRVTRDKNKTNIYKFHEHLRNIVWSDISGYNDPRYAYSVFLDKFTNTYNSCFSLASH
jgi:hypothetical protein